MGSPIHSFPGISDLQHILPKSPQSLLKGGQGSTQIFRTPSPAPPPQDLLTSAVVSTQGGWNQAPQGVVIQHVVQILVAVAGDAPDHFALGNSVREAAPVTRTSHAKLSTAWSKHGAFPASSQQLGQLGHEGTSGSSSVQGGSCGCAPSPCNLKFHTQLGSASLGFGPCYVTYRWQNKPGDGLLLGTDPSLKEVTSDPHGAGWGGTWDTEGNETAAAGPHPKGGPVVQHLCNLPWSYSGGRKSIHPAPILKAENAKLPLSPLFQCALRCFTRPRTCPSLESFSLKHGCAAFPSFLALFQKQKAAVKCLIFL